MNCPRQDTDANTVVPRAIVAITEIAALSVTRCQAIWDVPLVKKRRTSMPPKDKRLTKTANTSGSHPSVKKFFLEVALLEVLMCAAEN